MYGKLFLPLQPFLSTWSSFCHHVNVMCLLFLLIPNYPFLQNVIIYHSVKPVKKYKQTRHDSTQDISGHIDNFNVNFNFNVKNRNRRELVKLNEIMIFEIGQNVDLMMALCLFLFAQSHSPHKITQNVNFIFYFFRNYGM